MGRLRATRVDTRAGVEEAPPQRQSRRSDAGPAERPRDAPNPKKGGTAQWAVTAQTNGDRRLFVLGNYDEHAASFRPITAWEV